MEYKQVADKYQLDQQELLLLAALFRSREWDLVREQFLDPPLDQANVALASSDDINVILRAQGSKRAIKGVLNNYQTLINDMRRAEEEARDGNE